MKKLLFVLTTAVLLILTACDGSFVDPGMMDSIGGGIGIGGGGGGSSGGGSGSVASLSGTKWKCEEDYYGYITVTYTLTFTSASRVKLEYSMMGYKDEYTGTYTVSGSNITVKWDAGYSGSGSFTVNGNKLTTGEGYVFTKQ